MRYLPGSVGALASDTRGRRLAAACAIKDVELIASTARPQSGSRTVAPGSRQWFLYDAFCSSRLRSSRSAVGPASRELCRADVLLLQGNAVHVARISGLHRYRKPQGSVEVFDARPVRFYFHDMVRAGVLPLQRSEAEGRGRSVEARRSGGSTGGLPLLQLGRSERIRGSSSP